MAMSIVNNGAVALTLGELNKNIVEVGKRHKRIVSGQKFSSAGDGGVSEYAISEKMRVRLRALDQDVSNVQTGKKLLRVALGGIDSIVQELRSLREMAINAANDTNTDWDRATLQKEFDQRLADIDNTASTTNYNGKLLLDGTYQQYRESTTTITVGTATETVIDPSDDTNGYPQPYHLISSGVSEPTGMATYTANGNAITITSNGVFALKNNMNITFGSGVTDVKFVPLFSGVALNNVYITGPADGNANLWLEDVSIKNSQMQSFIRFQGTGNTLNFKGTNTLEAVGLPAAVPGPADALINVGGGLTVEGGPDGTGQFNVKGQGHFMAACIGTDAGEDLSSSNITVNSGIFHSYIDRNTGAFIGGSAGGSMYHMPHSVIGNITVNGGTFVDHSTLDYGDCIIGGGSSCGPGTIAGDITVRNAIVISESLRTLDPIIGGSGAESSVGDITIENSYIYHRSQYGAGIGTMGGPLPNKNSTAGNITISNSYLDLQSESGAGIGSAKYGHVGDITIIDSDISNVSSEQGDDIGKGVEGTCGNVTITGSPQPAEEPIGTSDSDNPQMITVKSRFLGTPLTIHHGTKANQALKCYINDMRIEAMGLSNVAVTTRDSASRAIGQLDDALEYALGEATTVGAYVSRLDDTEGNLVVASENTQSSESVLRDADIAVEMTAYTKSSILSQATQAMLAQANQHASSVLSLLQ